MPDCYDNPSELHASIEIERTPKAVQKARTSSDAAHPKPRSGRDILDKIPPAGFL
ncbi:MAG: hypothetical protein H0X34_00110 [Chthoniobacterales bacterium]|jgi:hypothetical protein|nr:hypothetical protein [Chthoniobacterales bacterium]